MIGLCSVTFRDDSVEFIIDLAKKAGIQAFEWGSDNHLPEDNIEQAEKVAQLMQEAGLTTSSYGSYYKLGSFVDFEPFIQIAQIVDASIIRVWAGEEGSADVAIDDRQDEWLQYIQTIEKESPNKHHYLIEFVPGEDQKQGLLDSVATLKAWLDQLNIEY